MEWRWCRGGNWSRGVCRARVSRGSEPFRVSNVCTPMTKCAHALLLFAAPLCAQTVAQLEGHAVTMSAATYQGKTAVRVDALPDAGNGRSYAIVKGSKFHNGTIEVDLAGKPAASAGAAARGFIGIAFRLQGERYEYIYLRPTNGRADDQIRRNHSTQYCAWPDYDFDRLRKEAPE